MAAAPKLRTDPQVGLFAQVVATRQTSLSRLIGFRSNCR